VVDQLAPLPVIESLTFVLWLSVLLAFIVDYCCGEPRRWHPLIGFGNLASRLERLLNVSSSSLPSSSQGSVVLSQDFAQERLPRDARKLRWLGLWGWLVLVIPFAALVLWLQLQVSLYGYMVLSVVSLYVSVGWQSLRQHALAVVQGYNTEGIEEARHQVSRIVSRDSDSMDEAAVARATIESVLENGSDAIFAPLFWFLLLGPVGAVTYRLANTLDAMWGYRNSRFEHYGWASANIDDWLNYIPARLTAISYALLGNRSRALDCWSSQARDCVSPNGGPVMCAGAGALGIELGGGAVYHGQWQSRTVMGKGHTAAIADIERSVGLIDRTLALWLLVMSMGFFLVSMVGV